MSARRLRFLFTTFDGGGNVAPIMQPIAQLIQRGHDVRVMSDGVNRDEADAAGARFVAWTRAPNKTVRSRDLDPMDWAAATPEEALGGMVQHFVCGLALPYAQDTIAELEREPADLVVNFDMLLGVMLACEARKQKLALLSTMVSMFPLPGVPPFGPGLLPAKTAEEHALHAQVENATAAVFDSGLPMLNEARAKLGLPALSRVYDQANAASVRWLGTARAFDFSPPELPKYLRYAGPLVRDPARAAPWRSPWSHADERPLVVVAFSTSFQNHAGVLQRIVDACGTLPVRVLVTLAGSIHFDEVKPASDTVVVESAPHTEVMREASIVVTHGGHGTVMTALASGACMLVIPHGRDQGDNAARVTARGAGLSLPVAASTEELRSAIQRLLAEPSFRECAQRLGAAVVAEMRDSTLVNELEELAAASDDASRTMADRRNVVKGLVAASLLATHLIPRSLRARSTTDAQTSLAADLRKSVEGSVIPAGSPEYESTRAGMTWNGRKTARMPDAIVRVKSVKDVQAAVRFAAARGLKVAVRSGGHHYHGAPVRDGGLLLDLSSLNGMQIDAPRLSASVQPALKSGALVAALTPLGLAFPVGHCADVSLGGFLLNGGIGWNAGHWGPGCMSVRGIEVVTADGERVYADDTHNRDLLWAARGAGPGFFGIVTRYDLKLHKLPRAIGVRSAVFDARSTEDIADWIGDLSASAPPQVEIVCVLGANGQPTPNVIVALFAFEDSESQARKWLAPIESHPSRAKVLATQDYQAATIASLQAVNDESFPSGYRFTADHCWSNATPSRVLSTIRDRAFAAPSERSFAFFSPNIVRLDLNQTAGDAAFSMAAPINFGAYGFWARPEEDSKNIAWVRGLMDAMAPLTTGSYVGEADLSVSPGRLSRCFSSSALNRLRALKKRYDPSDVFFSYLEHA